MDIEYGKYEYEKEKGLENEFIKLWYRHSEFILTFELSHLM